MWEDVNIAAAGKEVIITVELGQLMLDPHAKVHFLSPSLSSQPRHQHGLWDRVYVQTSAK